MSAMSDANPLAGTVALVTGAAQGIGRATALRLAADGAAVAVNDRVPSPELDEVAKACGGVTAVADVSDPGAVEEMVVRITNSVGPIDLLVANAAYMSMGSFLEQDEADWWRQVDTNLSGTFYLVRSVLPGMRQLGRGRIVIISSEWGVIGWSNATAYSTSKAGLIAFGKTLGRELAPENIITNVIAPGVVETPLTKPILDDPAWYQAYADKPILRRWAAPAELVGAAIFLASDASSYVTGTTLFVDGGWTAADGRYEPAL